MKSTALYLLSVVAALLLTGCTRNHGDIGIWFGTWHVESITIGGSPVSHEGDYFFQFQSHAFRVSLVGDRERLIESFGTWNEGEDGQLTVTFPDPDVYYIQMPGLENHNDFTVSVMSHGQIMLTKTRSDGIPCAYSLRKQP